MIGGKNLGEIINSSEYSTKYRTKSYKNSKNFDC